jgi:hypothetical protein
VALISPAAPAEMTSSGGRSPRLRSSSRKLAQASVDSLPPAASATNTGLPSVSMPHAASTGSARAPGCILNMEASRNR